MLKNNFKKQLNMNFKKAYLSGHLTFLRGRMGPGTTSFMTMIVLGNVELDMNVLVEMVMGSGGVHDEDRVRLSLGHQGGF